MSVAHLLSSSLNSSPLKLQRGLWWMMTMICVLFAPIAAEFYLITLTQGTAT